MTHQFGQARENLIVSTGDGDPALVLCWIVAMGTHIHGCGAHALADLSTSVVRRGQFIKNAKDRFIETHIDILPDPGCLCMTKGGEHPEAAENAG